MDSPIKYPTIDIPGRGTFVVKFGLGAAYTLEEETGMDEVQFARALQKWAPHKDHAAGCDQSDCECPVIPGAVSKTFLFKVLSACIWDQIQLTPRQIADAFSTWDTLPDIAMKIAEAFSKTQWSSRPMQLQEPATPTQGRNLN